MSVALMSVALMSMVRMVAPAGFEPTTYAV